MLLADALRAFREFGRQTRVGVTEAASQPGRKLRVETFVNEFWTARQRQANPLHEISYRACFKPQLPRFFIERLTRPGDRVYDPFMGRGTTLIEAALLGRVPLGCDANPLSRLLVRPRLQPPTLARVEERLNALDLKAGDGLREELLVFYHRDTLRQLTALRQYLRRREDTGALDDVDDWIRLVALNRLTGHSKGFFSVYTLPPNQAVSIPSQRRINERRRQVPPPRDVRSIILKKSRALLAALSPAARRALEQTAPQAQLLTGPADETPGIGAATVDLVVTSPPFLNVVQYATDNWLRCWFVGIDAKAVELTVCSSLQDWQTAMTATFRELARVLKPGGHVAFEVGEIHGGATRLEEYAVPCGVAAGLTPLLVLIHEQAFTKTANCWGVANMAKGTNTNRIVVFRKPSPQWAPSRGYSWE
ncbi:MAG: site-specific DNA-methyltransferase [Verrucomicrobia bacterium]|nr:site-specific DNA-methyltransferase [Verrucomicrobiota bacterium]